MNAGTTAVTSNTSNHGENDDHLLKQTAHGLDHRDAVGSLNPRALERVVKIWIFVRGKIQARRVIHHPHAHVTRKAIREKSVKKAGRSSQDAGAERETALETNEPPELRWKRSVQEPLLNAVEDAFRDGQHRERDQRSSYTAAHRRTDDLRACLPGEPQQCRNLAKSVYTRAKPVAGTPSRRIHEVDRRTVQIFRPLASTNRARVSVSVFTAEFARIGRVKSARDLTAPPNCWDLILGAAGKNALEPRGDAQRTDVLGTVSIA
jgi:hypothetical protein